MIMNPCSYDIEKLYAHCAVLGSHVAAEKNAQDNRPKTVIVCNSGTCKSIRAKLLVKLCGQKE
jgi:hypothetical protein